MLFLNIFSHSKHLHDDKGNSLMRFYRHKKVATGKLHRGRALKIKTKKPRCVTHRGLQMIVLSFIFIHVTMKQNQYKDAVCILLARLLKPLMICALRSALGLRVPMAY